MGLVAAQTPPFKNVLRRSFSLDDLIHSFIYSFNKGLWKSSHESGATARIRRQTPLPKSLTSHPALCPSYVLRSLIAFFLCVFFFFNVNHFKVFIEFVIILLLFHIFPLFCPKCMWNVVSLPTRAWTCTLPVIGKRKWKSLSRVWLCDPMDYTVHGLLQARILEWAAFPFSNRSSWPRSWTGVSCIAGGFFTNWAIREASYIGRWSLKPLYQGSFYCFS